MAVQSSPDSGNFVVDMVCDICRVEGFTVEKNVAAGSVEGQLVDIVASRTRGKKTQKVAFECWEGDRQINGHEVERFASQLRSFGLPSGVYVSPKGFTGDAEFMARKLGVELWDLARLKERVEKIKPPERSRVPGTLPVSRAVASMILAHGLENGNILRLTAMPKLEFRPYFYADFGLAHGKKRVARGVIVFDGVDGRECDAGLFEGHSKTLPGTGLFIDCLEIEPSTGSMPQLPPELEMKNTVTVAPAGISEDRVKGRVTEVLGADSAVHPDDITVPEVRLLHIPIVTVELVAGNRSYRKILQAATGKMIWDETRKCALCNNPTRAVCEECGTIVCHDHTRLCSNCRKHLCTECVTTKGVINKTPLCRNCHG
ncbi:MAG TPA: restriction endonuclease [Candidatus Bathyarchaeia archaeon]|nr:restriction endonuclease [Candidatus Bathyarchaeia archaeon]